MPTIIAIAALVALAIAWLISTQRKLAVLDENASNSMNQIGVQLSCRFDALMSLLNLTRVYARHESDMLIEAIRSDRIPITALSTPDDVLHQEWIISGALERIAMVLEQYPELMENQTYLKALDAVKK